MSKFVKGSLLSVIALSFGGCIFVSDDTTTGFCGDGFLDVGETCDDGNNLAGDGCSAVCTGEGATFNSPNTWGFVNLDFVAGQLVSTPLACPGGQFDTAAVISQATDSGGNPIGNCGPSTPAGTCFVDLFNCVDMAGTVVLPGGNYLRWIAITNNNGSQTYAQTPSAYITVDAATDSFGGTIVDNGGFFQVAWNITDGGSPVSCSAIPGQDGVGVTSTLVGTINAVDDLFTCEDGISLTGGIPAGNYEVSVAVVNTQNESLGTAPTISGTIGELNQITDLGTITIPLN